MERDRHAFERKLLPCMQHGATVDDSLTPIRMVGYDQYDDCLKPGREMDSKNRRMPPNLLFFEISMEAYMGYQWRGLNSEDPTFPRGAIMGGAFVAALSSWEFTENTTLLEEALHDDCGEEGKYIEVKKSVVKRLHEYFLHQQPRRLRHEPKIRWPEILIAENSIFSKGDVDIFLEVSPFTRNFLQTLTNLGFTNDIVVSFLVGSCTIHCTCCRALTRCLLLSN